MAEFVVEAIAPGAGFAGADRRAAGLSGGRRQPRDTILRNYDSNPCVCRMDIGNGL
jgi:hypothetical protein